MTGPMFLRKRPIVVSGYLYDGTDAHQIVTWIRALGGQARYIEGDLEVLTLDGWHTVPTGHTVIYGTQGEVYPIFPEVRAAVYDDLTDEEVVSEAAGQ